MKDSILKIKTLDGTMHEIDIDQYFYGEYNNLKSKQNELVLFPQEINNDLLSYCLEKLKIEKNNVFEIEFPKSITRILNGTFWRFKFLRGVKFNGNIEKIGYHNFSHTMPDLKGIWFIDPTIFSNLKSVISMQDYIPKDIEIFCGPDGEKKYEQYLIDSQNRKAPEVKIEFKLKDQTEPIKLKSEFEDSESANKYSCMLTNELLKKILDSAKFDFKKVKEIKISGAKIMGISNFTRFPNLKMFEVSEGINYIKSLSFSTKNNSDPILVLPKSLRPQICLKEGKVDGTSEFCDIPKYVVVNGNKELKKHFEDSYTSYKNCKIKIFETKQDLEKYFNGSLPDKNIFYYDYDSKAKKSGTTPSDQITKANPKAVYKPGISYLKVFNLETVISLVFPPLFIYLIITRTLEIRKKNQEIQKENSETKNKTTPENQAGPIAKPDVLSKNKKTKPAFKSKSYTSYTEKGYF